MKHSIIKQSHLPSLTKYLPNAVSAWIAACAQFQNPICAKPFCCSCAYFSPLCDRQICDVETVTYITNIYLNLMPYWTVELKTMFLEFLFSWYKQYLIIDLIIMKCYFEMWLLHAHM